MTTTILRSLLFVPGNQPHMLEKAFGVLADAIVPDLEDSVPDGEKAAARGTVADFLPKLDAARGSILPRVNALDTAWLDEDLRAVVCPHIRGISIGKTGSAADIAEISSMLAKRERDAGLPIGSLEILPWIETARGIVNCSEICLASERIAAVAFGAEDYTNDLGIERTEDETALLYARSALCTAAIAAGRLPLETPYFKFRDDAGLAASCRKARQLGFKGRFAIHPAQVETINACFTPSAEEIEQARRIVAAFEQAEAAGRGSTSLDGLVIDVPVAKRARAILAIAKATRRGAAT